MSKSVSISVISHGQFSLAKQVLQDLSAHCSGQTLEVILTLNIDEPAHISDEHYNFPVRVVRNAAPKGFGANHNAAFRLAAGDYFSVMNPDLRMNANPFPALLDLVRQPGIGVVAPVVLNPAGEREDSARRFPAPQELLGKAFGAGSARVPEKSGVSFPDWVAGMFMLFPSFVFGEMKGFDERYFLYYEDVDLCARLALAGYKRLVCPDVAVVHDARRSSHRNLRYAAMHLRSIFRFFSSDVYRQVRRLQKG